MESGPLPRHARRSPLGRREIRGDLFGIRFDDLAGHGFVTYIDDLIEMPELRFFESTIRNARVVFRSTNVSAQFNAILQARCLDSRLGFSELLPGNGGGGYPTAIVRSRINRHPAPASTNLQEVIVNAAAGIEESPISLDAIRENLIRETALFRALLACVLQAA